MERYLKKNKLFLFIIFLFLFILALLIFKSKFSIGDTSYFSLIDDQMISMRYAKNLAAGDGLVWNPGEERIEGFTNLLWTLYMSLFHLLSIPTAKISLAIQLSNVFFLLVNLFFVKKLADLLFKKTYLVTMLSVLFTAFYLPLLKWGIYGTEVSILTLLTTISAYLTCLSLQQKRIYFLLFFILGIGVLVRLDFITVAFVILLYLLIKIPDKKKLLIGIGVFGLFLITQTIFRLFYYGDIFPNTFYLKMIGYPILLRITTGLYVFFLFLHNMGWVLFFIPFITLLKKNKFIPLLCLLFVTQLMYSIYIGGDIGEQSETGSNRFISIAMPLFFILFSKGIYDIREALIVYFKFKKRTILYGVEFILIIAFLLAFNSLLHRNVIDNFFANDRLGFVGGNKYNTIKASLIDEITNENAKVAIHWAGTTPYFSQRNFIDLYGKSDKILARQNVNPAYIPDTNAKYFVYNPGHTKWDYAYSIGNLKPDISDVHGNIPEYEEVTFGNTMKLYLLKNSKNIKWEKVKELQDGTTLFN